MAKSSSMQRIGDILTKFNPIEDKYISREFQSYGIYLSEQLEDYKHKSKIYLLFGLRYIENIFYQKELEALANKYPNFSFDITLSRPTTNWNGMNGRVSVGLTEKIINKKNNLFYLCGSPEMVKDVRKILIDNKIDTKNIKFEIF